MTSPPALRIGCAVLVVLSCAVCVNAQALPESILRGTVVDQVGAAVADAHVSLTADGTAARETTTDGQGLFAFPGVAGGAYVVRVDVAGFTAFASAAITVDGASGLTLSPIILTIEGLSTSVIVRSREALADEQIKAQRHQRLIGVIPNFYVSYDADAVPLTSREKLRLAVHETFDWTAFVGASVGAALDTSTSVHTGFGGGAAGFAKRWAAGFADNRTGDLLTHYVFASAFHQDPRYFYQGTGTVRSRLLHAVDSALIARSDRGTRMPNYAYIFGNLAAATLSNIYYPHSERGGSLVLSTIGMGLARRAMMATAREFLWKRLSRDAAATP